MMRKSCAKMEARVTLKAKQPEKNQQNLNLNKYRRIQTMQKKCAEISHQCNVDVICIIYDRKFNRFREIRTADQMNFEKVYDMMHNIPPSGKKPKYQRVHVGYQDDEDQQESEQNAAGPGLELEL